MNSLDGHSDTRESAPLVGRFDLPERPALDITNCHFHSQPGAEHARHWGLLNLNNSARDFDSACETVHKRLPLQKGALLPLLMGFSMARRAEGDQILGDVTTLLASRLNVMDLSAYSHRT